MLEFQQVLKQIEELYSEEQVISELSPQFADTANHTDQEQQTDLKRSIHLYERWKMLIKTSKIEVLINYGTEQQSLLRKLELRQHQNQGPLEMKQSSLLVEPTTKTIIVNNYTKAQESCEEEFYEASSSFDNNEEENKLEATPAKTIEETTITTDESNTVVVNTEESSTDLETLVEEKPKEIVASDSIMEMSVSRSQMQVDTVCEPIEFLKCLDKLIISTNTVEKHLENIQKPNKEFNEFEKQDLKLNAIKQTLESLAMALKTSMLHKNAILQKSDKDVQTRIVQLSVDLGKQHQECERKFKEKKIVYKRNLEKWKEFNANFEAINKWLDLTLCKFENLKQENLDKERISGIVKVILDCFDSYSAVMLVN